MPLPRGPLATSTVEALAAMADAGLADAAAAGALIDAWRLQQNLAQPLKLAVEDVADPGPRAEGLPGGARPRGRRARLRLAAERA